MISPIPLAPGMDQNTMVNAINDTHRQLESENRTKIIKDEKGNDQILIGKRPNGNYGISVYDDGKERIRIGILPNGVYGLAITKPGYGIEEAITP